MTRITHHPSDALLLSHAAGRLPAGLALVVAVHMEACTRCAAYVGALEAAGGALLEETPPAAMHAQALDQALAALDAPPADAARQAPLQGPPPLPQGAAWPLALALAGSQIAPWRWIGRGMRYSRVRLAGDDAVAVFLLRLAPGKYLPQHAHSGREFTQVLCGGFHDGRAQFHAGDFDAPGRGVHHLPVVQSAGECVCLTAVQGRLQFDSVYGRLLGQLAGLA
ncbi:ChrR family anti-sigma-E factor [Pseudorhodoferax soli]|uniref:ChrR-like anti-ECFsigma factor n=1 Tax=Pseudorhodoferax soli TaxID=545864 RepID=A0A368XB92_9BURK|nr:ChrR family anti-sigma-E factor [Pseudorhodoferax soli]RCW65222.1 ChrR-like anti-ECFsigma factor [Pseudorhodoferax soli]